MRPLLFKLRALNSLPELDFFKTESVPKDFVNEFSKFLVFPPMHSTFAVLI